MGEIRLIEWNKLTVKQLRVDFDKAIDKKLEEFESMECTFYTNYAAYLLEFYEPIVNQLKSTNGKSTNVLPEGKTLQDTSSSKDEE